VDNDSADTTSEGRSFHVHVHAATTGKATVDSCCSEKADHTALSVIALQHADDGFSRRGHFGGSLVCSQYVLNVFARWHKVYGSGGEEFEKIGSM